MTDQEAFLRAICEHPFDILSRLVFADWSDENATDTNGYGERAEFIRLMCDGHDPPPDLWTKVYPLGDSPFHPRTEDGINVGDGRTWFTSEVYHAEWTHLPRGLVRNGFIQEIRCPLVWWVGGLCECFTNEPDAHCPTCHGTGRTPANGPAVVSRQPVTRVEISDREPMSGGPGAGWLWFRDQSRFGPQPLHPESDLPPAIRDRLTTDGKSGLAIYPTREAAVEALSRVLVNWARQRAGLTPIQWEASQ
jgi:uncharacterized protein (TIGR02996 family)